VSDIVDRIAAVLRLHRTSATRFCAGCDWDGDVIRNDFGEAIGYRHGGDEPDHEAHVAERVVAELQLTEEVGWLTSGKGHLRERRWMSAWSEVQP
jgi:hypothetical protein